MDDETPLRGKQVVNLASLDFGFDKDFQVKGFHTNIQTQKNRPAEPTFSRKNITQTLMNQKRQSPTSLMRNNVMQRKKKVLSPPKPKVAKEEKKVNADSFLTQTSSAIGSSTGGWTTREAPTKMSKQ
jgi:hypothetical protein